MRGVSPRAPRVTDREIVRSLELGGWSMHHVAGSHYFMRHPNHPGRRVTVAVHAGEAIKRKSLRSILDEAGLSSAHLRELL
ncbi:MAG: type II toxin-antitoxin system HicA family toxin [Chloroflexota bacterium]